MARTVEFEGRVIEVPDDATDDEVAEIITATSAPSPAPVMTTTPVDRSVANTARTRLARRGLTPQQIKANPPAGPLPGRRSQIYAGIGEMFGAGDDSGFDYTPRTADGGLLANLGRGLNPRELAAGMGERALNLMMHTIDPLGSDPSIPADERTSRGVDMTDLGAPDLPAIYQEASRRGEQGESLAGMYGSALAQSLLAGTGIGAGRMIRNAPARAAAAEAQYTEATGAHGPTFGPRPVAREMLDRGIVVSPNPAEQAAVYRTNVTALNTQRAAIPGSRSVRGPTGRLQPSTDPVAVANTAERTALKARAQMETNIAEILEAIPETRSVGGAVGRGANSWFNRRLTVGDVASLGVVSGIRLLWSISHQLVKTNQWRTALPVYKYRFANALMTGDANTAAATGALIASGQATGEKRQPSTPAVSTPTPTPTPTPNLSERRLGGQNEFNGPFSPTENEELITLLPPSLYLPERFKRARSVNIGMTYPVGSKDDSKFATEGGPHNRIAELRKPKGVLSDLVDAFRPSEWKRALDPDTPHKFWQGVYGLPFDPKDRDLSAAEIERTGGYNTVLMAHGTPKWSYPQVLLHETGHSAWYNGDVTPEEKQEWTDLHNRRLAASRAKESQERVPTAISERYPSDPSHSWAELFGHFIANPREMKKLYPPEYAYFRKVVGREYVNLLPAERRAVEGRRPNG